MQKKVAFRTLGCKLNFAETSTLAREFEQGGFSRAQKGESPDIIVVNSCSVTGEADKKCRALVRRLTKDNPEAIIAVTGCYAQLKPEEVASIEGVDLVVGNNSKGELYSKVAKLTGKLAETAVDSCSKGELTNFFNSFSGGDRTRAFLKVQDGCSYHCAYCTIPLARGESRNISIEELVAQAQQVAKAGQKEIVLTGVNVGDFGRTTGESFFELIQELDKVEGIERYRISSIEPNLLTDEIIEFCAQSKKFMPHFHIPLQGGTNEILALMRRRYTTELFAQRIAKIREVMPHAFIGIDVIAGFPGESDEHFQRSLEFLKSLQPAFLHIFPYSERDNTDAVAFEGKVPQHIKRERVARLGKLCEEFHADFYARFKGQTLSILWEATRTQGMMHGYSENYIKLTAPYDRAKVNHITQATL